jgi:hypothetical protein
MPIHDYVRAIEQGAFDPSVITKLSDFSAQHQGQTLFQILAIRPGSHALFQACLLRYVTLRQQDIWDPANREKETAPGLGFQRDSSVMHLLGEVMSDHYSLDELHQISLSPSHYVPAIEFVNRTALGYVTFGVEEFLLGLVPKWRYPVKELHAMIKDCKTLDSIDVDSVSERLLVLAEHPLYKTFPNSVFVKLFQWSEYFIRFLARIPELKTGMTVALQDHAKSIRDLKRTDLASLSYSDRRSHLELLVYLYYAGNSELQDELIYQFDKVVEASQSNPVVMSNILSVLQEEECGENARLYHLNSRAIISRLSVTSCLKLLYTSGNKFKDENLIYYNRILSSLSNVFQSQEIVLTADQRHMEATVRLAYILSMGNFERIQAVRIHLPYEREQLSLTELCSIRSIKIVFATVPDFNPVLLSHLVGARYPNSPCMIEVGNFGEDGYSVARTISSLYENGLDVVNLYIPREAGRCIDECAGINSNLNLKDMPSVSIISLVDHSRVIEERPQTIRDRAQTSVPLLMSRAPASDEDEYVMVMKDEPESGRRIGHGME